MPTFQSHHLWHSWFSVLCRSRLSQSWIFRLGTAGIALALTDRTCTTSCRGEDGRRSHWTGHRPPGRAGRAVVIINYSLSVALSRRPAAALLLNWPVAFVNWHHSTRRPQYIACCRCSLCSRWIRSFLPWTFPLSVVPHIGATTVRTGGDWYPSTFQPWLRPWSMHPCRLPLLNLLLIPL